MCKNDDVFMQFNPLIEERIEACYEEEEFGEAHLSVLRTLLAAMEQEGHMLIPVETPDNAMKYFDPDKIESIDVNSDLETLVNTYMTENMDALIEVLNSQGEEALQNKIVNDLIGDILDLFSKAVVDQGGMSENSVLILKNIEDKWVITEFKARV